MAPTDNVFPSSLTIFTKLYNIVAEELELEEDDTDESMVETVTDGELGTENSFDLNFESEEIETTSVSSFELNLRCEETMETESDEDCDETVEETPTTSYNNIEEHRPSLCRRLVFASRHLFLSDTDDDDENVEDSEYESE